MSTEKKKYKIILLAIWVLYAFYEAYFWLVWAPNFKGPGPIIKADFIIFWPILFLATLFLLYKIFKK